MRYKVRVVIINQCGTFAGDPREFTKDELQESRRVLKDFGGGQSTILRIMGIDHFFPASLMQMSVVRLEAEELLDV